VSTTEIVQFWRCCSPPTLWQVGLQPVVSHQVVGTPADLCLVEGLKWTEVISNDA
jgi:hypothetical protein